MSSEEEALRIKILQSRLRRARLQEEEAEMEHIQRALALQDQEEEIEFNREQRGSQRKREEVNINCERNWKRPSIFLHTNIYLDEEMNKWVCCYTGVMAFGETPATACDNFDHLWTFGR